MLESASAVPAAKIRRERPGGCSAGRDQIPGGEQRERTSRSGTNCNRCCYTVLDVEKVRKERAVRWNGRKIYAFARTPVPGGRCSSGHRSRPTGIPAPGVILERALRSVVMRLAERR
jgi:hypothetical protein